MLEPVASKPSRREQGKFSDAELSLIDELLQRGAELPEILSALGTPEKPLPVATFYFRLKKSGKRIDTKIDRRLVNA